PPNSRRPLRPPAPPDGGGGRISARTHVHRTRSRQPAPPSSDDGTRQLVLPRETVSTGARLLARATRTESGRAPTRDGTPRYLVATLLVSPCRELSTFRESSRTAVPALHSRTSSGDRRPEIAEDLKSLTRALREATFLLILTAGSGRSSALFSGSVSAWVSPWRATRRRPRGGGRRRSRRTTAGPPRRTRRAALSCRRPRPASPRLHPRRGTRPAAFGGSPSPPAPASRPPALRSPRRRTCPAAGRGGPGARRGIVRHPAAVSFKIPVAVPVVAFLDHQERRDDDVLRREAHPVPRQAGVSRKQPRQDRVDAAVEAGEVVLAVPRGVGAAKASMIDDTEMITEGGTVKRLCMCETGRVRRPASCRRRRLGPRSCSRAGPV
ncbi:hypothetical protein THAOC_26061, partial [Thalassiosira oceanica]